MILEGIVIVIMNIAPIVLIVITITILLMILILAIIQILLIIMITRCLSKTSLRGLQLAQLLCVAEAPRLVSLFGLCPLPGLRFTAKSSAYRILNP